MDTHPTPRPREYDYLLPIATRAARQEELAEYAQPGARRMRGSGLCPSLRIGPARDALAGRGQPHRCLATLRPLPLRPLPLLLRQLPLPLRRRSSWLRAIVPSSLRASHSMPTKEPPAAVAPESRSLRAVVAQYGFLAFVFHESIWAMVWAGMYLGVKSGIDIPGALASIPDWVPGASQLSQIDPTAGAVATSYLLVTCTGPVRLGFTITCMPFVARRWDRWCADSDAPPYVWLGGGLAALWLGGGLAVYCLGAAT